MTALSPGEISVLAPDGIGEVTAGTDLASMVVAVLDLRDGDVVVVTSKVVSKAEGQTLETGTGVAGEAAYAAALEDQTRRVVARRGRTQIVVNRLGLVMAAAGIDRSNVRVGTIVVLPSDPDASAAQIRSRLLELTGVNVAVIITDTAGRAWREGQSDIAIGVAGLRPSEDFAGQVDHYGNPLAVTLPAVADEIAGASELAQTKLGGRPIARLRGRPDLVLPIGVDGPGAVSLQRPEGDDLFGFGAREAVVVALSGETDLYPVFGSPASVEELLAALRRICPADGAVDVRSIVGDATLPVRLTLDLAPGLAQVAVNALCVSHGWSLDEWLAVEGSADHVVVACLSPRVP